MRNTVHFVVRLFLFRYFCLSFHCPERGAIGWARNRGVRRSIAWTTWGRWSAPGRLATSNTGQDQPDAEQQADDAHADGPELTTQLWGRVELGNRRSTEEHYAGTTGNEAFRISRLVLPFLHSRESNVNLTRSKRRGLFESRAGYGCADRAASFYLDPVGEEAQVWETVDG